MIVALAVPLRWFYHLWAAMATSFIPLTSLIVLLIGTVLRTGSVLQVGHCIFVEISQVSEPVRLVGGPELSKIEGNAISGVPKGGGIPKIRALAGCAQRICWLPGCAQMIGCDVRKRNNGRESNLRSWLARPSWSPLTPPRHLPSGTL